MTKKPTELELAIAVCLQLIPEEKEDEYGIWGGYNQALRDTRKAFEDYFTNNS